MLNSATLLRDGDVALIIDGKHYQMSGLPEGLLTADELSVVRVMSPRFENIVYSVRLSAVQRS